MLTQQQKQKLKDALDGASMKNPEHKKIIKFRFGLIDGDLHTQRETADAYGMTQPGVQYIEKRFFEKVDLDRFGYVSN